MTLLFPRLRSGIFGERLPLRYYLSGGMVLSGLFTALFGFGYFWNIHVLWYFIIVQVRVRPGGRPNFGFHRRGLIPGGLFFLGGGFRGWPSFPAGERRAFPHPVKKKQTRSRVVRAPKPPGRTRLAEQPVWQLPT